MMCESDRRQNAYTAVGLFLLTLLSRVPFHSQILYHWDSVNFAYAMREFSMAKEQPQPPGYLVYVWLCRLVDLAFHDAQTTMVVISVAASALAVVALFYLGRSMFKRWVGLIAALFLAASPLFWFYGEIALPHTLDTLLVIVSVWWLYEVTQGNLRYLYPAVAVVAIAGGVRQQTIIFLAPLLLFALRGVGWKRFLLAGVLGAAICLAWFVPLMILSGGFPNYMRVMGEFTRRFQSTSSVFIGGGWWGVRRNLVKLTLYSLYGWSLALVPGVIYAVARLRWREWPQRWERPAFLILWIAPVWIYYTIVHMGQQGLVFVFLPALLLVSAVGLERLLFSRPLRLIVAVVALIMVNAAIFCLSPEYPVGGAQIRLLTRATLANSDHYYQDRFEAIKSNFAPESIAILAANWHHVEYYLPGYPSLHFDVGAKWEQDEGKPIGNLEMGQVSPVELFGPRQDGQGRMVIVIFDPVLEPFNAKPERVAMLPLAHGGTLRYLTLAMDEAFQCGEGLFGIVSR